jgi:SHS2 domain-containing protein
LKSEPNYELIDHTADLGILVFGSGSRDLFENAALAMFDCIVDIDLLKCLERTAVTVSGDDRPDLMVNWLRELLYLWSGKEMLVKRAIISTISEHEVSGTVCFDRFDPEVHAIKNEIKAVTYHQIRVDSGPEGWEAQVVFDV